MQCFVTSLCDFICMHSPCHSRTCVTYLWNVYILSVFCRIDLAVTALKYVFKCLDHYWRSESLSAEERQYLINIQVQWRHVIV